MHSILGHLPISSSTIMQPFGVAAVHILDHLGGVVICCCYLHEACARCRIPACFFGAEETSKVLTVLAEFGRI